MENASQPCSPRTREAPSACRPGERGGSVAAVIGDPDDAGAGRWVAQAHKRSDARLDQQLLVVGWDEEQESRRRLRRVRPRGPAAERYLDHTQQIGRARQQQNDGDEAEQDAHCDHVSGPVLNGEDVTDAAASATDLRSATTRASSVYSRSRYASDRKHPPTRYPTSAAVRA